MEDVIYFSKVEFRERIGYGNTSSIMLLNIPERELSYQVFRWKKQMPTIQGTGSEEWSGKVYSHDIAIPARQIRNSKTEFERQILKDEQYEQEVVFSYAIDISEKQMKELLPYCNALDFVPYRDRKMSMNDKGYIGYRDEVQMFFRAITDSYIPLLELPMEYYYDEEHIWPSEKLYRYLVMTFFQDKKKLRGGGPTYGGFSLFM